jgi:hypothetical protein
MPAPGRFGQKPHSRTARQHRATGFVSGPVRALLRKSLPAGLIVIRMTHDLEQLMDTTGIALLRTIDRLLRACPLDVVLVTADPLQDGRHRAPAIR